MNLIVYVEGVSEEFFVNRQLRPHLQLHGWSTVKPIGVATSPNPEGQRGGPFLSNGGHNEVMEAVVVIRRTRGDIPRHWVTGLLGLRSRLPLLLWERVGVRVLAN